MARIYIEKSRSKKEGTNRLMLGPHKETRPIRKRKKLYRAIKLSSSWLKSDLNFFFFLWGAKADDFWAGVQRDTQRAVTNSRWIFLSSRHPIHRVQLSKFPVRQYLHRVIELIPDVSFEIKSKTSSPLYRATKFIHFPNLWQVAAIDDVHDVVHST